MLVIPILEYCHCHAVNDSHNLSQAAILSLVTQIFSFWLWGFYHHHKTVWIPWNPILHGFVCLILAQNSHPLMFAFSILHPLEYIFECYALQIWIEVSMCSITPIDGVVFFLPVQSSPTPTCVCTRRCRSWRSKWTWSTSVATSPCSTPTTGTVAGTATVLSAEVGELMQNVCMWTFQRQDL